MSQVAFDAPAAVNRPLPSARPAPSFDQAPATPFASLLDDAAPPDSPPPPTADDRVSRADQSDPAHQAARDDTHNAKADAKPDAKSADATSADGKADDAGPTDAIVDGTKSAEPKPVQTKLDAKLEIKPDAILADAKTADRPADDIAAGTPTVMPDQIGKPADVACDFKAVCDGEAAVQVKTGDQTTSTDDATPAADTKPADVQAPAVAVAIAGATLAPVPTPITPLAPADGALLAADPIEVSGSPAAAMAAANISLVATPKPKNGAAPSQPVNIGAATAVAAPKVSAQGAVAPQTDDKPQAASGDAEKTSIAQARGEVAGKDRDAAPADAALAPTTDATNAATRTVADATQPSGLTAPTQNTPLNAAANAAAAPHMAPPAAAIPVSGLAIEIATKASEGKNHFEIRLDPPELGRIEVRLAVDKDGNVTSRLIADRADTLDLLRRDQANLERALQDAGLKTADNSLQFSLRDHSSQPQQDNSGSHRARLVIEDTTLLPIDAAQRGYSRLAGQGRGIDIHV